MTKTQETVKSVIIWLWQMYVVAEVLATIFFVLALIDEHIILWSALPFMAHVIWLVVMIVGELFFIIRHLGNYPKNQMEYFETWKKDANKKSKRRKDNRIYNFFCSIADWMFDLLSLLNVGGR